eukprot:15464556-Alexandrium_andersonii.AAC.1
MWTQRARGNPAAAPLFPNANGGPPAKYSVIQTSQRAAVAIGFPVRVANSEPLRGGHALRGGGTVPPGRWSRSLAYPGPREALDVDDPDLPREH